MLKFKEIAKERQNTKMVETIVMHVRVNSHFTLNVKLCMPNFLHIYFMLCIYFQYTLA
jgi:hypothetical protein